MPELKTDLLSAAEKITGGVASILLDNGMKIYVLRNSAAPTVSIQAWVETGSIHEGKNLGCGLSHFLEHMLFQGCAAYPGQSVSEIIAGLGGDFNAYTSFGNTVYYTNLPAKHFKAGAKVLASMLTEPEFPLERFELEKEVILRERDMIRDNPDRMLLERLWNTVYTTSPIRHPVIGYMDKIREVDREMMIDYYNRRYSPERAFFVVCGDVSPATAIKYLSKLLSPWRRGSIGEVELPQEPRQLCARSAEVCFDDPNDRLALGFRLPPVSHRDIPAIDVMCGILGQNRSSRLVKRFHTNEELAMAIGATGFSQNFGGIFCVSAVCGEQHTTRLRHGIEEEIAGLAATPPAEAEIEREITLQTTDFLRGLQRNSALGKAIGNSVMTYKTPEYALEYMRLLAQVKPEEISRVTERYLRPGKSSFIHMSDNFKNSAKSKSKRFRPQKPECETLKTGSRLITCPDSRLPLFSCCFAFPGGSFFETPDNAGVCRLLSNLLQTGPADLTEDEFAEMLDEYAIDCSVSSGANTILLTLNCRSDLAEVALELTGRTLRNPRLSGKAFLREKNNLTQALHSRALDPQNAGEDKLLETMYGGHPYALPRSGRPESVERLCPEALEKFFSSVVLNPSKTVFSVGGMFEKNKISGKVEKLSDALFSKTPKPPEAAMPQPEFPASEQFAKVELPREQAFIMYAVPGCDNRAKDRFCLDVLQAALNHLGSELYKSVREDNPLAYYAGLSAFRGLHPGYLAFYAGCAPEYAGKVAGLLQEQQRRLRKKGLSKQEFKAGKEALLYSNASIFENPLRVASSAAIAEYYGNGFDIPWKLVDIYSKLTLEEVNAAVKKYMACENGVTIAAGAARMNF